MKKIFTLILIYLISSLLVRAQDLIILKSGQEIKSKVLEITQQEIKYKKFENLDGPTISISKGEVNMIKYQNGTSDVISANQSKPETETSEAPSRLNNRPFRIGFYAEPLGFVQFGPSVGTEMTFVNHLIIGAHLRFFSLGLIGKVIYNDDDFGGVPDKISGMDFGGSIKALFPSKIGGLYTGVVSEYGSIECKYHNDGSEVERKDTYVLGMASIGYKFRFPSGFYINTGGNLGVHTGISHKWHYTNSSTWHNGDNSVDPFGMLEVAIGIEF